MKTRLELYTKLIALCFASLLLSNCDGDTGPEGLQGPQGEIGSQGPQGQPGNDGRDGNANIISSPWFFINPWEGTAKNYSYLKSAPEVTQEIIDNGVVLAYTKLAGGGGKVRPLPTIIGSGANEYNFQFNISKPQEIEFTSNLDGSISNASEFRYVVIPQGVASKSNNGTISQPLYRLNNQLYTLDELKAMSYKEISLKLNLE